MMCYLRFLAACGLALMPCLAGCGCRDGLTVISGTVVYGGRPVQRGVIAFLPVDGNGPTAAAVVSDGKYSVKAAPGLKRVQIEAYNVIGRRSVVPGDLTSPMVDLQEQFLPVRYNTESELTCEITGDAWTHDFVLEK